ncbi:hypothetical protein, partial [Pectobacterium sp. IFB5596]|uniref:hypothetical protein n=1 Tax=Pectobacterium sp. IFB5596 TaxID=1839803 RepID=UPI001F1BB430
CPVSGVAPCNRTTPILTTHETITIPQCKPAIMKFPPSQPYRFTIPDSFCTLVDSSVRREIARFGSSATGNTKHANAD